MLHIKFEFHSNRDTLTYFTAKNRSKSFICINGLKNHVEASDLVHTPILYVSWSLLIFVMVGQFLALWRTKTLERGCYQSSQPAKSFPDFFFCTCFEISVWNLAYTFSGWCHTSSSSLIPIWTLWPTLQPKIGQIHLSACMALKIILRPQIWYTHSNSECIDPYWFLSCLGNFWPSAGQKYSKGGVSRAPSQWHMRFEFHQNQVSRPLKSFPDFFLNVLRYQLESWFIHWVGFTTNWVHVSLEWDPCDLLHVLSLGTVN